MRTALIPSGTNSTKFLKDFGSRCAHLLQCLTCSEIVLVVTSGYLRNRCPCVISNQSRHSPLTSCFSKAFCPKELLPTGYFFSLLTILCKLKRYLCVNIQVDRQFLEYSAAILTATRKTTFKVTRVTHTGSSS